MNFSTYRKQFPTSLDDDISPLCRQQDKSPTPLDTDFIDCVSLAYHHGENHEFALQGYLLETGEIAYKHKTQISEFSAYKEQESRAEQTENYSINTEITKDECDYLRNLGYSTHFGGEQFIVNSPYSLLQTQGDILSRISSFSNTLNIEHEGLQSLKTNLELTSNGFTTMSSNSFLDENIAWQIGNESYSGMAAIVDNAVFCFDCLLVSQNNNGIETIYFYDTITSSISLPIFDFPRIHNDNWDLIKVNRNFILFIDNNNLLGYIWDLRENKIKTFQLDTPILSIANYLDTFILCYNNNQVAILSVEANNVILTNNILTNCVYLNTNEEKIYAVTTNNDLYCKNNDNWFLLTNLTTNFPISSFCFHKNNIICTDGLEIYTFDTNYNLIFQQTLNTPIFETPQEISVNRGHIFISSNYNSNPTQSFSSYLSTTDLILNATIEHKVLFAFNKLFYNNLGVGLFTFEPKLTSDNKTSAITSGIFFYDGNKWITSLDFDDCLDLRAWDELTFPLDYFNTNTFNDDQELNKPRIDISYFPDAIQTSADLEPDTYQFKISNKILPPNKTSSGFLANYPIFCFSIDRRYSGYQEGTQPYMRLQYHLRGNISDVSIGNQAKREIDKIDKNLTEVSVVTDIATLQRTNTVQTQGSCRWSFGKKPCDYNPYTQTFVVSIVASNDPNSDLYIFTIEETASNPSANNPNFNDFDSFDANLLVYGTVEFLEGENKGYILPIRRLDIDLTSRFLAIELLFAAPYPITVLTSIELKQGCSKSFSQCITYGQQENFGGQPYIQGNGIFARGTNYKQ